MPAIPDIQWSAEEFFDAGEAVMIVQKACDDQRRLMLRISSFTMIDDTRAIGDSAFFMASTVPGIWPILNAIRENQPVPDKFKAVIEKVIAAYNPFVISIDRELVIYNRKYVAPPAIPEPALPKPFDFNNYQAGAATTVAYPQSIALPYVVMGLLGETGEIANKVKKIYRDNQGAIDLTVKQAIAEEAGDALWYIARLCSELGLSMADVAKGNLSKLHARKKNGTLGGSGDYR